MANEDKQFIQLIRSALTAIDGLWFLEVEDKFGFEKAFEIDIQVWKRYGNIIIKRIKKTLSLKENNLDAFLQILQILCEIDGTKFEIKQQSPNEVLVQVNYCPWWENLKRSHREKLVRCDIVDKLIFPEWAKYFNPKIDFQITRSLPNGHDTCEWIITLKDL
jgi:hypothetical protein